MFSKACEYAIRAMIYILKESVRGVRVGVKEIAKKTDTPEPFVAKVLQTLSRSGIVNSVKGPNGGFFVEPHSKPIPLVEIVRAIDGDRFFVSCGLGIKNCSGRRPCPIHHEYSQMRDGMISMLKRTSVQQLAEELEQGQTFLVKR